MTRSPLPRLTAAVTAVGLSLLFGPLAARSTRTAYASMGGVGIKPAHSDPADPATLSFFEPMLRPGGEFRDEIVVTNRSDSPVGLLVTAVDGVTAQTTGAVYANRHDPVTKAGRWVTPGTQELAVAAGATVSLPFTVQVPTGAAPGDHLAGIAFEDLQASASGKNFAVTHVVRLVMPIQIQVPGAAAFKLRIERSTFAATPWTDRQPTVLVPLTNEGTKLGAPRLSVALTGPNGYAKTVDRQLDTVLPGDSIVYPLVWPDALDRGDYTVTVSAGRPGTAVTRLDHAYFGTAVLGATQAPTPSPGSWPHSSPVRSQRRISLPAWIGVAAVAGLSGGFIAGRVRRSRCGRRRADVG